MDMSRNVVALSCNPPTKEASRGLPDALMENVMELAIELNPLHRVDGGLHLVAEVIEIVHKLPRHVRNGVAHDHGLQHPTQLEDLTELIHVELVDDGATVGVETDEAFRCQVKEGLADRSRTDAELASQLRLNQPRTSRKDPRHDLRPQPVPDVLSRGRGAIHFVRHMGDHVSSRS